MAKSSKSPIIESIFNERWNAERSELSNPVVTFDDVQAAISKWNNIPEQQNPMSSGNPANFFKDLTRLRTANANWPASVFARGFTGQQAVGERKCFEFIRIKSGQTEPFPNVVPHPTEQTPRHSITSAVLPLASREFGRQDEEWLLQVAVKLRLVETHFCVYSPRRAFIRQVDHLQNSLKLHGSQIDAVFLAHEIDEHGNRREIIITCEAKEIRENVTMEQLVRQPRAAFSMRTVTQNVVVPIALKAVAPSQIHMVEFSAVERADAETTEVLTVLSEAVYILQPPVPGIGGNTKRQPKK